MNQYTPLPPFTMANKNGGRSGNRTHDLWLRRPTLYPSELPARIGKITPRKI